MSQFRPFSMVTAISFDGDATLWDFERVMRQSLEMVRLELQRYISHEQLCGLSVERMIDIRNTVARDLKGKEFNLEKIRLTAFCQTLASVGIEDEALAQHLNEIYLKSRFANIELYPDVLPVFDILRQDFVLGLLSNGKTYPERCGLAGYFSFVVFAQDYGVEKPHPRLFEIALEQAGCTAAELLHVGDSLENDVAGAQGAGIQAVWLNRQREPNVTGIQPDSEIVALSELYPCAEVPANKRVQPDAAPRPGSGAKIGYMTHFDLKRISEKSRRG